MAILFTTVINIKFMDSPNLEVGSFTNVKKAEADMVKRLTGYIS